MGRCNIGRTVGLVWRKNEPAPTLWSAGAASGGLPNSGQSSSQSPAFSANNCNIRDILQYIDLSADLDHYEIDVIDVIDAIDLYAFSCVRDEPDRSNRRTYFKNVDDSG